MRIGIDTAAVCQGGGIGRYARNLIRTLALLDSENQYRLFVAGRGGDGLGAWPSNFAIRSVPISDRWIHAAWQRLRLPLPIQVIVGGIELFHSPDFVLPPTGRTPAILTVHDLSFMRVPRFFVPGFRRYFEGAVSRAVARAAHVLADSESTRQDLIQLMAVEPARVSVLYPGVEARFRPIENAAELSRVRRRYALPDRFVLGVSTLQPRKNFDGLVHGFQQMLERGRDDRSVADLHLVIAGGKGWMFEETMTAVERAGLGGQVHFPGFVADADLPALYNLATVFAFPSWYEGFGIPVLEAMACGTPVVAANNSSLPEVVGSAGLMVDAGDSDALAIALARLVKDRRLREGLVEAGAAQAQLFTWEAAAKQLLGVYQSVV